MNIHISYIFYNDTIDDYSYYPLKVVNDFYQDIFLEEERENAPILVKSLNNKDKCKIFVSIYKLEL